jgi:hypothetical protein
VEHVVRTTSGCDVEFRGDVVTKTTTEPVGSPTHQRLVAQHEWLSRYAASPLVVNVGSLLHNGYEMERLEHVDDTVSTYDRITHVIAVLKSVVWSNEPVTHPGMFHQWYLRWRFSDLLDDWKAIGRIHHHELVDVHGDPTVENVLVRSRDGFRVMVLTDPLPDAITDGKLPSVRALDVGKLLQSAIGYEAVKCGVVDRWSIPDRATLDAIRATTTTIEEWRRSLWFLRLHVRRLIPYQTPRLAETWTNSLKEIDEWCHSTSTE